MASNILAAAAIRGATSGGGVADRLKEMREAMQAEKNGLPAIQGTNGQDGPKSYTIDVGAGNGTSFGDTLKRYVNQVSDTQDVASDLVQRFVNGEPVELHQVMAKTEEASLSLELMIEIRNKFTEAYRSVMAMQS
ncbi:MAG: flagellar hook-basal body complex protein FliE [Gemmatimonadaceae bacterium]